MKTNDIILACETLAKTRENKKVNLKDVNIFFTSFNVESSEQTKVIHHLEDKGILETPKGFSSMSVLQLKIHRFINEQLLVQLMDKGEAKLKASQDELKSLVNDDGNGFFVLNKKGDLIKPSCNNTNVTQARKVKELKKMQEQIQK